MRIPGAAALLLALLLALAAPGLAAAAPLPPAPEGDAVPTSADAHLARGVARRVQNVPDLHDITVTATAGVVRLDGRVAEPADRMHAEQIARQHPGVREVDNRVELSTSLTDRMRVASGLVQAKLVGLVARIPLLLVAGLLVLVAWWLARALTRRIHLSRFSANNPYIDALVGRLLRWGIVLLATVVALDLLEATAVVGALLGSAGVLGIAVGFAFRDIAENYVAGILLSLRRGFSPGDHILVDKYEGRVVALTARSTVLVTFDGNQVTIPNGLVFKSVLTNFSQNQNRRFEFTVVIDVNESARESQQLALEAIAGVGGVLGEPGPSGIVDGYAGGGIQLKFFGWVNQRESDLGKVRSESIRAVKSAFEKARIDGPRPMQYVFSAPLPEDVAERLGVTTGPKKATEPTAAGDTSPVQDIDGLLDAERRAHAGDTLI